MKALTAFILFASVSFFAFAQTPAAISYQGIITDPNTGETVANGPHSIKFAFYDAPLDGNLKWQTSVIQVTTFKGLFTTIIPVPTDANWEAALFVELTVDGSVLPARIQLTTVPYAFRASTMNAAGLSGTIVDERLSTHLQDLSDGELTGSKVGAGIKAVNINDGSGGPIPNTMLDSDLQDLADGELDGTKIGTGIKAGNITNGILPAAVLPAGMISGAGTSGQLAYWTNAAQLSSDGLYWDQTQNELGIGTDQTVASTSIVHNESHTSGVAVSIDNSWNLNTTKTGVNIGMNSNGNGTTYGININVSATGIGTRDGVNSNVASMAGNASVINGLTGSVTAAGTGSSRGVYGKAQGSSTAELIGVRGESIGAGTGEQSGVLGTVTANANVRMYGVRGRCESTGTSPKYGVYGEVSGAVTGGFGTHFGVYGTASGGTTNYAIYGSGDIYATGTSSAGSDRKLKQDIEPLKSSLSKILAFKPSTYYYRFDEFPSMNFSKKKQIGLIAQDVETLFPELVSEALNPEQNDAEGKLVSPEISYKALNYVGIIPVLIKGIQEQQMMIDELKSEIQKLKSAYSAKELEKPAIKASAKK